MMVMVVVVQQNGADSREGCKGREGEAFFLSGQGQKRQGQEFLFCDQFNLLSGSSRWRMAHGAGVCASDSAACVAAVFFDVSCKGSL